MLAHSSSSVGLDDGLNSGSVEYALCQIRLRSIAVFPDHDKFTVLHTRHYNPSGRVVDRQKAQRIGDLNRVFTS